MAMEARDRQTLENVDSHATGQGRDYLNQASQARIEAMASDAIYRPDSASQEIARAERELGDLAARNGWAPEVTALKRQEMRTQVHAGIVQRLANVDAQSALQYLSAHKDTMAGEAVVRLETALAPMAKQQRGRRMGAQAAGWNMGVAFDIASGGVGMNEGEQAAALEQYLKDGGAGLDPRQTAWCAAFVNATLAKAGLPGTGSNLARSFLNWGTEVSQPQRGDLVVLSRGEAPFGHVGFFDGVNEDGSIRILGGNQGDSVSVASYRPDRVLGFRRAAEGARPDVSALLDIEDPMEREAALSEYNLRVGIEAKRKTAQRDAAIDAGFRLVEGGGSVDNLTLDQRQTLGMEGMSSLRSYQDKVAAGQQVETDEGFFVTLMDEAATDPQRFLARDPATFINSLSTVDYRAMLSKREAIQRGEGKRDDAMGIAEARTAISTVLEAAGVDDRKPAGAKTKVAMEAEMLRWQGQFTAQQKRKPTPQEINKRAAEMLVPVVIDPAGFGNEVDGAAVEINYRGQAAEQNGQIVRKGAVSLETLAADTTAVRIGDVRVPPAEVALFIEAFVGRYSRQPSSSEVIEGLISSGFYTNGR